MHRIFQLLSVSCGKLLEAFLEARLRSEMPGFDERKLAKADHPSDDPRLGGDLPMVSLV